MNNTHEGENTILYAQTAKYVLKSYFGFITKGKPLNDSVKYIEQLSNAADVKFVNKEEWTAV